MIHYRGETIELFMDEEIKSIEREIRNLFKEELKCNKNFIEIISNDLEISILFNKMVEDGTFRKSILKLRKQFNSQTEKYHIVGSIENFDITKNNIKKLSDRLRWILEAVNKCLTETWTDKFFRKLGKKAVTNENGNKAHITYNGSYLIIKVRDIPEIRLNDEYDYDLIVSDYYMIGINTIKRVEYIIKQIKDIMEGE